MAAEGIVMPPPQTGETNITFEPMVTRQQTIPEGNTINAYRTNTRASRRSSMRRTATRESQKAVRDPNFDINLPYRTLTAEANLAEYTSETPGGTFETGHGPDGVPYTMVGFEPGDKANPKNWSKGYKWYCTMVVALTCFVVALCSSVITADIASVAKEFNVSEEVALLSITVFVIGFGVGMY
jgi:hypothetical protein